MTDNLDDTSFEVQNDMESKDCFGFVTMPGNVTRQDSSNPQHISAYGSVHRQKANSFQISYLTNYIHKNKTKHYSRISNYVWPDVCAALNKIGPPEKTETEWKAVHKNLKYRVTTQVREEPQLTNGQRI